MTRAVSPELPRPRQSSLPARAVSGPLALTRLMPTLSTRRAALLAGTSAVGLGWRSPLPVFSSSLAPRPSEAELTLRGVVWEADPPFSRQDFRRLDESDDALFYDEPKLVNHIDDAAVRAANSYYAQLFNKVAAARYGSDTASVDVLDLCSSWVSHFPTDRSFGRVAGLGMNQVELERNPQLTEFIVRDLNKQPSLPYKDASFDVVTCTVSIDYLTSPVMVMAEVARVLRPGGVVALIISNRLFFSKAIALWTGKDDLEHIYTVGGYLHYGGADKLNEPAAVDLRPPPRGKTDPLYAIYATRV